MRAKPGAIAAVNTDFRFLGIIVPIDGADQTGFLTVAAADALIRVKPDAPVLARGQSLVRADPGARRIGTGAADDDAEAFFHAADRPDTQAGFTQANFTLSPGTGEHA